VISEVNGKPFGKLHLDPGLLSCSISSVFFQIGRWGLETGFGRSLRERNWWKYFALQRNFSSIKTILAAIADQYSKDCHTTLPRLWQEYRHDLNSSLSTGLIRRLNESSDTLLEAIRAYRDHSFATFGTTTL
jgi:hypothetical protein